MALSRATGSAVLALVGVAVIVGYLRFGGLAIVAVALSSILGQFQHMAWLYSWGGTAGMALPTASCFLVVGIAMFLRSHEAGS